MSNMWIGIITAIVLTILIFSFGKNRNQDRFSKEGKNNASDPGADGGTDSDSSSGFGGSGAGSS